MKLLFVGDVVGGLGPARARGAAARPARAATRPTSWSSTARTPRAGSASRAKIARRAASTPGADAITLGNHAYRHRDVYELPRPRAADRAARPTTRRANPGRGHTVVESDGARLGVVNLSGTVFIEAARSPVRRGRRDPRRPARQGRPRARRLPRRGHEREGRDGLAPRRPRDRLRRHAHPRARPPTRACCPAGPPTSPTSA